MERDGGCSGDIEGVDEGSVGKRRVSNGRGLGQLGGDALS